MLFLHLFLKEILISLWKISQINNFCFCKGKMFIELFEPNESTLTKELHFKKIKKYLNVME